MVTIIERFRKPVSWVFGIMSAFLIVFSLSNHATSMYFELAELAGLVLIIIATLGRIWSSLHIVGSKNSVLCDIGPYSMCRNPLYVFSFLGMIGIILVSGILILLPPSIILFTVYYGFVVRKEEERLLSLFGLNFQNYCSKTPRLLFRLSNYRPGGAVTVNLELIQKRIIDAMWFLWLYFILEILEIFKNTHVVPILLHTPF
ncbi:MAG: isoprenylcysteine carboxylmethyltransferase family protein [Magnetococcales bacterium]|nr:isoprenylcysteine carboxylmethyltransferase family protein [Magnetococcales bacterium]MBF0150920.1 isoprenylcysteine carboxylmethyltransferase family protein [Magnetococcales bacterium]